MRLVLGGESLLGPLTGIGQYTYNLAKNFERRADIEDLNFLARGRLFPFKAMCAHLENDTLKPDEPSANSTAGLFTNVRTRAAQSPTLVRAYHTIIPAFEKWAMRKYTKNDLFHSPNYMLPPFNGARVVTILDLSTFAYPEFHPEARVKLVNSHIFNAIKNADHILTISHYVKEEIINRFNVSSDRISTTHLGVDDCYRPLEKDDFEGLTEGLALTFKQYFLFLSTIEPRKNLDRLLDAYELYVARSGKESLPLIIAGVAGWKSEHIHRRLQALEAQGLVRYLGYLQQRYIPALVGGARALLYPSLYEGFGLPIVEAMKSGTAVLTSQDSAMSEVAGDSARLVSALDVEDISEAILQLSGDDTYVSGLVRKGLERSEAFSWQQCAEETLSVYHRALG